MNRHEQYDTPRRFSWKDIETNNQTSFESIRGGDIVLTQTTATIGIERGHAKNRFGKLEALPGEKNPTLPSGVGRVALAGNMSPIGKYGPEIIPEADRPQDTHANAKRVVDQLVGENWQDQVVIMRPDRHYDTPLGVINVDQIKSFGDDGVGINRPDQAGDMLITFNPETVLAVRPADCPIVGISAKTIDGQEFTSILHLAWLGTAHDYVGQAKEELDKLGVDWSTVKLQISAGAHSESYRYTNYPEDPRLKFPAAPGMFMDVEDREKKDDRGNTATTYSFGIDAALEPYNQIAEKWPIDPKTQVWADTSDSAASSSGYSSHSRSRRPEGQTGEGNTRDLVLFGSAVKTAY